MDSDNNVDTPSVMNKICNVVTRFTTHSIFHE
jgi:hypothetical protein